MRCLFCDFVNARASEHRRGYAFEANYETRNTVSFLSLDSPVNREAHLIVIPKVHFRDFHSIPPRIKAELIEHVARIGRFYSGKGRGYNILLNNSREAGQYIPHSHFHVIPRRRGDMIRIEVWKRERISPSQFRELARRTREEFRKSLR